MQTFRSPQSTDQMQILSAIDDDRLLPALEYVGMSELITNKNARAYNLETVLGAKGRKWTVRVWAISPHNNVANNVNGGSGGSSGSDGEFVEKAPVAICSHGHGESLGVMSWAKFWPRLHSEGIFILAFEAPCFGRSSGQATGQANLWRYDDAELIIRLLEVFGVSSTSHRGIVFGECMGAGISLRAMAKHPGYFSGKMILHNTTIGTWPLEIEDVVIRHGGGILAYHETDPDHMREAVAYKKLIELQNKAPESFKLIDCPNARASMTSLDFFEICCKIKLSDGKRRGDEQSVLCPSPLGLEACLKLVLSPIQPPKEDEIYSGPKKSAVEMGTMSDGFKVIIRIRPPLSHYETEGIQYNPALKIRKIELPAVSKKTETNLLSNTKSRLASEVLLLGGGSRFSGGKARFIFDHVFDTDASQVQVYENSVKSLLDTILETGDDGTIFAYGQTGSGKTHTITGDLQSTQEAGIIPRVMDDLFEWVENSEINTKSIAISFVELADGEISDLLSESKKIVKTSINPSSGTSIIGTMNTTIFRPTSKDNFLESFQTAAANRRSRITMMNDSSSRSHSILTIYIQGCGNRSSAQLSIVDLAGCERVKRSGVTVEDGGLQEAAYINTDLLHLGRVIKTLINAETVKHVPFRDSLLTQLLSPSLGGTCRALMIACVSPGQDSVSETGGTLSFAANASHVQNKVFDFEHKSAVSKKLEESSKLASKKEMELELSAANLHLRAPGLFDHSTGRSSQGEFILPGTWNPSGKVKRTKQLRSSIPKDNNASPEIHVLGNFSAGQESPLVVLLHYYSPGKSGADGSFFLHWFDQLAASGIRVLAPTFPGHGMSRGVAPTSKPESKHLGEVGKSVILRVLDYLGERKCYVLGYDWGGGIALELGLRYPSRIQGVLAWNASHRDTDNKLVNLSKSKMAKEKKLKVVWEPHPAYHPLKNGQRISKSIGVELIL
jgi:pimeloyl-ACP methyl ester carboxylesterase